MEAKQVTVRIAVVQVMRQVFPYRWWWPFYQMTTPRILKIGTAIDQMLKQGEAEAIARERLRNQQALCICCCTHPPVNVGGDWVHFFPHMTAEEALAKNMQSCNVYPCTATALVNLWVEDAAAGKAPAVPVKDVTHG